LPSSYEVRGDVVWPARLVQPPRPPALVYLDMHVYIRLARVAIGKPAPDGYIELLETSRRTKREGRALFPLSATHLMEMADVQHGKRADVAGVMEDLSDFHCLVGRLTITRLEVESALDEAMGNTPSAGEGVPLPSLSMTSGSTDSGRSYCAISSGPRAMRYAPSQQSVRAMKSR
jgi:hypothetical protein